MRETETAIVAEINCDVKWDEWEKQVNAQIKSGLTVKEWCRQNRVNEKTYYYHLRRVREKLCEDHSQQIVPISAPEPVKSSEIHTINEHLKKVHKKIGQQPQKEL